MKRITNAVISGIDAHSFGIVHCHLFSAEMNNAGGSQNKSRCL